MFIPTPCSAPPAERLFSEKPSPSERRRRIHTLGGCPISWLEAALRRVAGSIARHPGEVDDLVQIGLEIAWELAPDYEPGGEATFFTFIYRRVRGAMVDARNKESSARLVELDETSRSQSPEEALDRARVARKAMLELDRLEESDRALVVEVAMNRRKVAHVAMAIGLGYDAVWFRYRKALRRMKQRIGRLQ